MVGVIASALVVQSFAIPFGKVMPIRILFVLLTTALALVGWRVTRGWMRHGFVALLALMVSVSLGPFFVARYTGEIKHIHLPTSLAGSGRCGVLSVVVNLSAEDTFIMENLRRVKEGAVVGQINLNKFTGGPCTKIVDPPGGGPRKVYSICKIKARAGGIVIGETIGELHSRAVFPLSSEVAEELLTTLTLSIDIELVNGAEALDYLILRDVGIPRERPDRMFCNGREVPFPKGGDGGVFMLWKFARPDGVPIGVAY